MAVFNVWSALAGRLDATQWRPRLAKDIQLREFEVAGGPPYVVIANPRDLVHYRLTAREAALLPALDGQRTLGELVGDVDRFGELDGIVGLVRSLESGGFLSERPVDLDTALEKALHPPTWSRRASEALRSLTIHWRGAEPMVVWIHRHFLRRVYTRAGLLLAAAVTLGGAAAVARTVSTHPFHLTNRHLGSSFLALLALDLLIIFIHELGHASVLVHYGRRVKGAGFRIYFGTPAFFIESSDALMLPRGRRMVQAAAGPGLESVATGIAGIVLWLHPSGAGSQTLYQFVVLNYFVLFLNLVPMLELDGYWILSDLLRKPDLRPDSLAFVRHEMWRKLRRRERFRVGELGLAAYGTAGILFTVACLVSAFYFWRRVFGDTVVELWHTSWWGPLLVVLLVLLFAGPAVRALLEGLRALARAVAAQLHRVCFRAEERWRVDAATLLDDGAVFGDVPVEVLNDLAGRFRLRPLSRGQVVVREGALADAYYLVRTGELEVLESSADGEERRLRTITRGQGFGELGVANAAPRNATVRATRRSEVFELDKASFDRLLADRVLLPSFAATLQDAAELRRLPVFAALGLDELSRLARDGAWRTLAPGEVLMHEGACGDAFWVIGSGQLAVERSGVRVAVRVAGEHVGDLALLHDAPRSATVRALTPTRAFRLDQDGFTSYVAERLRRVAASHHCAERVWDH